jgi:hypothetical protein
VIIILLYVNNGSLFAGAVSLSLTETIVTTLFFNYGSTVIHLLYEILSKYLIQ